MKLFIKDENEFLYEMANFSTDTTGERFVLWIDEFGKERKGKHSLPRFKPKANDVELDIVIDGDKVRYDKATKSKLDKFKFGTDALKFVERFKKPLLMHWNREIDTAQLGTIIRLVIKKKYSLEDAIKFATED